MSGAPDAGVPLERPPGALRALGVGLRLAHANFLRLYPLALLVGGALELLAIATGTATGPYLFGRFPAALRTATKFPSSELVFATLALVALGWTLPVLFATALVARAARERLQGRPARPLASLGAGARVLHVAALTAVAFAVVPLAAMWFPTTVGDARAMARTYLWVVPLSLPLIAAVIGRWIFALPAAVLEKRGLIGAWRRSERLVIGRQLPTVALVLLGLALWYGPFGVLIPWLASKHGLLLPELGPTPWTRVLEFARVALAAWFHLVVAVVTTVYFVEVRRAKEGPDADELRQVFK